MDSKREWLTEAIVKEYQSKVSGYISNGRQDIGQMRKLRIELMERCGVTETEALNILSNYHVADYLLKYEILSGKVVLEKDDKRRKLEQRLLEEVAEMESKMQVQMQMLQDMMDD